MKNYIIKCQEVPVKTPMKQINITKKKENSKSYSFTRRLGKDLLTFSDEFCKTCQVPKCDHDKS